MAKVLTCRECGETFQARRASREFCGNGCRRAFNNRRAMRGADFYDVVMAMRFDRDKAHAVRAWSLLCRMASVFRSADRRERKGRRSWDEIDKVRSRHTHLTARLVGTNVAGYMARREADAG